MNVKILEYVGILIGLITCLEPSYVHPDEQMQSLEVLVQRICGVSGEVAWEFMSGKCARSFVPLYMFYGPAVYVGRYVFGVGAVGQLGLVRLQNYMLFVFMYRLALQFLLKSKLQRSMAGFLMSTSYVAGSYYAHTFSNSVESIILLMVLSLFEVLVRDSRDARYRHYRTSVGLGFLVALGVFNRITFPAFILLPAVVVFHKFYIRQWGSLALFFGSFVCAAVFFVYVDTKLYGLDQWTIAPLNNLLYNLDESNLADHGLHPRYTHLLVNIPQLLGPALLVFVTQRHALSLPMLSCISGITALSLFKHQEARFLIPLVPLFLMSVDMTNLAKFLSLKLIIKLWLMFNLVMSVVIGVLHQRGVILALDHLKDGPTDVQIWWKTYPPPTWMLMNEHLTVDSTNIVDGEERVDNVDFEILDDHVVDLKGCDVELLNLTLSQFLEKSAKIHLIMPKSVEAMFISLSEKFHYNLTSIFDTYMHLDLDHIDPSNLSTIKPGLHIYEVTKLL
ncbi:glycosylphosphatidylinositol-alpha 1,2 mannosyltransferase Ecym_4547 [Eremothecium cymbalariae DBVPG|uniref:Mannosyltransferase n=1 Tax=Eremothecium cymbalariae (strain CBS 270.75 / DBVPG 7215 / KCTC 17166 / NRRL Y-17582) TaxID=931890 RepID=G8JU79_ERECY|nr:hypothetical protein Ecym_4547 [Eremothecium cymbalariae DBVPG\